MKLDLSVYLEMLTYKRPYGSEYKFAEQFLAPLGIVHDPITDNWMLSIGESDTIFTCHIDTVHHEAEQQKIIYAEDMGIVYKDDKQPLGADDASGMFIMMNMVKHKVPGLYLFHVGEECGGIGSDAFALSYEDILKAYNKVISFDRKGQKDIITHQAGGRCCSDVFAKALSRLLSCSEDTFRPDDTGLFTDSANYTHLISECTNVSVGYEAEHTHAEMQDVNFLMRLIDKCIVVDWDSLPVERDPTVQEFGWGGYGSTEYYDDMLTYSELMALVVGFPDEAANLLYNLQITVSDVEKECIQMEQLQ